MGPSHTLETRPTRRAVCALAAAAGALALVRRADAETLRTVTLQPLGPGSVPLAVFVERALRAFYPVELTVAPEVPLPKQAYYPPRNRYRAEKLLDHLDRTHGDAFRVLGLTSRDISTTKGEFADFGILGLASLDGRACVLSSFRCQKSAKNPAHAVERLGKTAVHELGTPSASSIARITAA